MARQFGIVRPDLRRGRRAKWLIDCFLDGKRFKLRGYITRGGKRIRFSDEHSAREALEEIRADIRSGRSPLQAISDFLPAGAPEMAFQRHYRRFVAAKARQGREGRSRQLSAKRIDELRGHERRGHLEPLLSVPVHAVSFGVLEDWRDWLFEAHGLAPRTVHHLVADVGTCLRWLKRRGELEVAPDLPTVHVPDYAPKIPTPTLQERILEVIPWGLRGLFLVRGYMGLRPSEAARANEGDWWFDPSDAPRDVLTVHGKGGRVRYLPAHPEVQRWVREFVDPRSRLRDVSQAPAPLFKNPKATNTERRWEKSSERRVMLRAMGQCGVRFKPNEVLRHGFGTEAVNRKGSDHRPALPIDRIGEYMGHSDPRTTKRYAKLSPAALEDVPRKHDR